MPSKRTTTENVEDQANEQAEESQPVSETQPASVPDTEPARRQAPEYVVATKDLYVNDVRAHVAGDLVPQVNVDRNGWADSVKPRTTE